MKSFRRDYGVEPAAGFTDARSGWQWHVTRWSFTIPTACAPRLVKSAINSIRHMRPARYIDSGVSGHLHRPLPANPDMIAENG
jgi:hypothetical protein